MGELGRDPFLCPKVRSDARRKVLRRFPYCVIYLAEPEHIEIIAVIHFARDPRSWASRLRVPSRAAPDDLGIRLAFEPVAVGRG